MGTLKKQLFVFFFFTLICFSARADEFLFDKTYSRDNSYCRVNSSRFEIKIKGHSRYTEAGDAEYGENIFILSGGNKLLIQKDIGRYRLVKGENSYCSKVLSISTAPHELAIFLKKDNRPLGNTLSILYYNYQTQDHEIVDTNHLLSDALIHQNRLQFKLKSDSCQTFSGPVMIGENQYFYTQKDFEPWIVFDGKNFTVNKQATYQSYKGSLFFKSESDFFKARGRSNQIFTAVNHQLNKECVRFTNESEWICADRNNK